MPLAETGCSLRAGPGIRNWNYGTITAKLVALSARQV